MDRDSIAAPQRKARRARLSDGVQPASAALDRYLAELRREPRLTREEERATARRSRDGDADARSLLVRANLRFVVNVARKYAATGVPLLDLIGAGNLGLVVAADRFDPERGVKFISFAVWHVRRAIQSAIGTDRTVRIPSGQTHDVRAVLKTRELLRQRLEREPTAAEIGQVAQVAPAVVRSLIDASGVIISLDAPMSDDETTPLRDMLADEDSPDPESDQAAREQADAITGALEALPAREARVLRLYFGLDADGQTHTLEEIGAVIGVTRERVRQLRERALCRIRSASSLSA